MVEEDPEKAWEVVGSLPGNRESRRMDLLAALMNKYPQRALELVRVHRDEVSVASAGARRWAGIDPLAMLPIINELPPGRGRTSIVGDAAIFYTEGTERHAESKTWFAQLTPELRNYALKSLGRYRSRRPRGFEKLYDSWEQIAMEAGDPP